MDSLSNQVLSEFIVILTSCALVLTVWEGFRGFKNVSKKEKGERVFFLVTIMTSVLAIKLTSVVFAPGSPAMQWVESTVPLFVLVNTQILMLFRYQKKESNFKEFCDDKNAMPSIQGEAINLSESDETSHEDKEIAETVSLLLVNEQLFLQANLKVSNIARKIDLPEFRISKAMRNHLNAKNFNQYVNELRVNYARKILEDSNKLHWSVLVVGLESGFASVGSFTRSFKAQCGVTPNQYRQFHKDNIAFCAG